MNPVATSASHCTERRVAILSFAVLAALAAACGAAPSDGASETGSSAVTVGGSNGGTDWAATVSSGTIATAIGSFPSVTGVTSVTDSNANNYMLQMNSQSRFTTAQTIALCSPNGVAIPNCAGWQQFFLSPRTATGPDGGVVQTGRIYIEYWLLGYNAPGADGGPTCPPGWIVEGGNQCKLDSPETTTPFPPVTNLANVQLKAGAGAADTLTVTIAGVPYSVPPQPSVLGLNKVWSTAEFNVFGNLDLSNAVFNSGSTITVQTLVTSATPTTAAPVCSPLTTTGETSNLNLNTASCTAFGGSTPGIQFNETNLVGGACGTNSVVSTAGVCEVVGSSCTDPSGPPNTYIWDSAGACVAVGSGCGTVTGYIIDSTGQCVGVGSGCDGPNTVLSNTGYCVTIGSSCIINGDAPGVWSSGGQCFPQTITCPPGEVVGGPDGNEYCYVPSSSSSGGKVGSGSSGGGGGGGSSSGGCPKCVNIQ
jgi:hypothetical protein